MSDISSTEHLVIELTASELPETVLSRFQRKPSPAARFTVTVEPSLSADEKLEALRRDIDAGLDALDAGYAIPGDMVFADLKARFPAP